MSIGKLVLSLENGHFIANDGCFIQDLYRSPIQLDREHDLVQEHEMLMSPLTRNSEFRRENLLYFNEASMDCFFREEAVLPLKCPVCGEEYRIRREDYLALKKAVLSPIPKAG